MLIKIERTPSFVCLEDRPNTSITGEFLSSLEGIELDADIPDLGSDGLYFSVPLLEITGALWVQFRWFAAIRWSWKFRRHPDDTRILVPSESGSPVLMYSDIR